MGSDKHFAIENARAAAVKDALVLLGTVAMCGAVVNGGVVVHEFLPFGEEKAIQHGLAALTIQSKIQIVSHPIALDGARMHTHLT